MFVLVFDTSFIQLCPNLIIHIVSSMLGSLYFSFSPYPFRSLFLSGSSALYGQFVLVKFYSTVLKDHGRIYCLVCSFLHVFITLFHESFMLFSPKFLYALMLILYVKIVLSNLIGYGLS